MAVELTVILKDSEKTFKQKFLCYDTITIAHDDDNIIRAVAEAKLNFVGEPEDVILNFKWMA